MARRLRIAGRVQGVGFRDALCREAARLGVRGWVRNRGDGTVEALADGPEPALAALIAWAHRGPPAARVESVTVGEADEQAPEGFEFRPGV